MDTDRLLLLARFFVFSLAAIYAGWLLLCPVPESVPSPFQTISMGDRTFWIDTSQLAPDTDFVDIRILDGTPEGRMVRINVES